jgi:invasion protein IalB
MSSESIVDPLAPSAAANSITRNPETDRAGPAVAEPALRRVGSKFGRVALTLALIAGGVGAVVELASGQQKPSAAAPKAAPKATAAIEAPAAVVAPVAPEKVNNTMPAWTVGCFSASRAAAADCKIEQRLFIKETGRALSIATIDIPGATRKPVLLLHLPNGLALQDGVSFSIDGGAATPLLLQSCDGNGCYATLALTPAVLETMKTGKVMAVKAIAANREVLTFQHLLTDFAPALAAAQ